jgi:hypothetical protein
VRGARSTPLPPLGGGRLGWGQLFVSVAMRLEQDLALIVRVLYIEGGGV